MSHIAWSHNSPGLITPYFCKFQISLVVVFSQSYTDCASWHNCCISYDHSINVVIAPTKYIDRVIIWHAAKVDNDYSINVLCRCNYYIDRVIIWYAAIVPATTISVWPWEYNHRANGPVHHKQKYAWIAIIWKMSLPEYQAGAVMYGAQWRFMHLWPLLYIYCILFFVISISIDAISLTLSII